MGTGRWSEHDQSLDWEDVDCGRRVEYAERESFFRGGPKSGSAGMCGGDASMTSKCLGCEEAPFVCMVQSNVVACVMRPSVVLGQLPGGGTVTETTAIEEKVGAVSDRTRCVER